MNEEQRSRLTPDQRTRLDAAERQALKTLSSKISEGRKIPRRHQVVVLAIVLALAVLAGILVLLADLIRSV